MNRRQVLAGACGCGSIGGLWYVLRPPRRTVEIRFWRSPRAASHDGVGEQIVAYLEAAFSPIYDEVEVTDGGVVSTSTEHGYGVMRSGEWPRRIADGFVSEHGIDPVADVNLLVTDGPMTHAPSGAGIPHLASVGGARYLTGVPPREDLDDVVPYRTPERVMQVLLHEVGHALGLNHEHGTITSVDGMTIASPMVSTYAWATDPVSRRQFDAEHSSCGTLYPEDRSGERHLSFAFSGCESAALRDYRGGLNPDSRPLRSDWF